MVDIRAQCAIFVNKIVVNMNPQEQNFLGLRLKLARKIAGLSLQDLADRMGNAVTKQALNKYELGLMNPSMDVFMTISKVLKVRPDYFLKKNPAELGGVTFRKRARLSKEVEESAIERVRDYVERFFEVERILGLEHQFKNPIKAIKITQLNDVEIAAIKLRSAWELGSDPISNIIEMLEIKGVKVLIIDDVDDIDGLSANASNGAPVIVINVKEKSIERIRFTAIHELAHLLLDFDDEIKQDSRQVEKMCHYFSSCFLIPTKMLNSSMGGQHRSYINIRELIAVKEYFGISLRAILHRLEAMGVITQNYYQRWMVYLINNYGPRKEPGSYKGEEKQKVLGQLVNRALAHELITLSKAASLLNLSLDEFRKDYDGAE